MTKIVNKNWMKRVMLAVFMTVLMVCCSNESVVTGTKESSINETTSTTVYTPQTEAGKTYSLFSSLMKDSAEKLVGTVNNYVDLESNGSRGSIRTVEDIVNLLPNDLSSLKRTVVTGRGEEEVTLEEEFEGIVNQFNKTLEKIKPNPSDAQTLDYCDATDDGVIIGGDMIIKNDNIMGAITIEMLNAEARGESAEKISEDIATTAKNLFGESIETEGRGLREVSTQLWNNGVIYYQWGSLDNRYKRLMREAMNEWEKSTSNEVRFIEAPTQAIFKFLTLLHLTGVVTIKNGSGNFAGSSNVGYMPGYSSVLKLNQSCLDNYSDIDAKGTCLHELGHVLGLKHEHQRWDRDSYIDFVNSSDKNNTTNYGMIPKTKTTIRWVSKYWWTVFFIGVPIVYPVEETVTNSVTYGVFDYNSIMMYDGRFKAKVAKQEYKKGDVISRKQTLSTDDIAAIKAMY